jgi:thermitase
MSRSMFPKVLLLILLIQFLTFNNPLYGISKECGITSEPKGRELIVGVREMTSDNYLKLVRLIGEHGKIKDKVFFGSMLEALVISLPTTPTSEFIQKLMELKPSYIEPNMLFKACMVPNDPYWKLQWGVRKIQADYAWNITMGSPSILMAIIDTGVDWKHEDLAKNYVPLGYDWVNGDKDPMDDNGHGTHVCGIASSVINNNLGIAGISQVKIMAEKALNQTGYGYADDLAQAITHAADQGAKIMVMSWGSNSSSILLKRSIQYAYSKGAILVAAAGNDASNVKIYPAAYDEVIAVSATNQIDDPATFTNYGDWIELSAPGVSIYSTLPNNTYGYMSGTSMSAPFVAGVAALVWSVNPNLTSNQVRAVLRSTADDLGPSGFDPYYGYGRVNAWKAVKSVISPQDIALTAITPNKNIVGEGFTVTIKVNATNLGQTAESFNISLYANSTKIQTTTLTLNAGESTSTAFTWNTAGFAKGNYTIMAYAEPLPNEQNTSNNIIHSSKTITITMPGDINADGKVDMRDIGLAARSFGTTEANERWNPIADINNDQKVDMKDLGIIAINFGKKDP